MTIRRVWRAGSALIRFLLVCGAEHLISQQPPVASLLPSATHPFPTDRPPAPAARLQCQQCGEGGELVCCDGCTAAYHEQCAGLEAVPEVGGGDRSTCTCIAHGDGDGADGPAPEWHAGCHSLLFNAHVWLPSFPACLQTDWFCPMCVAEAQARSGVPVAAGRAQPLAVAAPLQPPPLQPVLATPGQVQHVSAASPAAAAPAAAAEVVVSSKRSWRDPRCQPAQHLPAQAPPAAKTASPAPAPPAPAPAAGGGALKRPRLDGDLLAEPMGVAGAPAGRHEAAAGAAPGATEAAAGSTGPAAGAAPGATEAAAGSTGPAAGAAPAPCGGSKLRLVIRKTALGGAWPPKVTSAGGSGRDSSRRDGVDGIRADAQPTASILLAPPSDAQPPSLGQQPPKTPSLPAGSHQQLQPTAPCQQEAQEQQQNQDQQQNQELQQAEQAQQPQPQPQPPQEQTAPPQPAQHRPQPTSEQPHRPADQPATDGAPPTTQRGLFMSLLGMLRQAAVPGEFLEVGSAQGCRFAVGPM